jgi:hypothetical protein
MTVHLMTRAYDDRPPYDQSVWWQAPLWPERVMTGRPSYDIKIVLGDLNTRICKEECYCPAVRKNSLH